MTQQVTQTRAFTHQLTTIVANTCESPPIDVRPFHSVQIFTPATWTGAAIGVKVSPVKNTLHKPLYMQEIGAARSTVAVVRVGVCSVAANGAYVLPSAVEAGAWVRLWSYTGEGTDFDQTANRVLGVSLKG